MYNVGVVEVQKGIIRITGLFYGIGLWHRDDETITVRETRIKICYSIFYLLFPISIMVGAWKSDNQDESVLLVEAALVSSVLSVKLFFLIWRKKQIVELLNRICVYSIKKRRGYKLATAKLNDFMKFIAFFVISICITGTCVTLVLPFFGREKRLFLNIGFPLDYKNNEFAYWMAFAFHFSEVVLSIISFLFSIIMWYTLLNCAIKYEILGVELGKMGVLNNILFGPDLIAAIKSHAHTNEYCDASKYESRDVGVTKFYLQFILLLIQQFASSSVTNELKSFLSNLILFHILTSGLCICGSIYCLAFSANTNVVEVMIYIGVLMYNIFDIFMVMYFGNEIKFSSDRLLCSLFECNWLDQSLACKKSLIIFGEHLKQPQVIVIGNIYPLSLETFTRILNSAYRMFNILKNLK